MADIEMEIINSEKFQRANIRFTGIPSEEIRNELKKTGWLWSRRNGVWYPKNEIAEESLELAQELRKKYFTEYHVKHYNNNVSVKQVGNYKVTEYSIWNPEPELNTNAGELSESENKKLSESGYSPLFKITVESGTEMARFVLCERAVVGKDGISGYGLPENEQVLFELDENERVIYKSERSLRIKDLEEIERLSIGLFEKRKGLLLDDGIEQLQANGGLSDAALEVAYEMEQAAIDAEAEWERENSLTAEEETEIVAKVIEIKPVSLEEILSVMEMKPEMTPDGKIRIFDQQRGEYIDNGMDFEGSDSASWEFASAADIFERLDTYINDHFIHDMEEQLEAGGVTLRGDETLEDLCNYAKEQLEAGITTVPQEELNIAMGIVNPDTVIMPGYARANENQATPKVEIDVGKIKETIAEAMGGKDRATFEDVVTDKFAEYGMTDDNGHLIQSTLKPNQITRIREQCREILAKYDNEHFTEREMKILRRELTESHGKASESDIEWASAGLRSMKYILVTQKTKNGYWDTKNGTEISASEARKLLSPADFVSGISRATFHYDAGRDIREDGIGIHFDCTDREKLARTREAPPYELSEADKAILAQYEGAGGLNEENRTNAGILNEFYTPENLVEKVWQIVDAYAPDAKTVLEPSAGTGKFASNRPNNEFTMHELDETSARINKILHPDATVVQGAFQKQFFDDGERFKKIGYEQPKYDVVIGNPPYGAYADKYKGLGEGREFDRYEEYFISKGLDALKDEKSIMAFVVPSGFLNTAFDKQKEVLVNKGLRLLDAYRLPERTFPTTQVGTDIIVLKKFDFEDGYVRPVENQVKDFQRKIIADGEWFKQHPEKVLGEVKTRTNRFGKEEEYVAVHDGLTVQDELNKITAMFQNADRQVTAEGKTTFHEIPGFNIYFSEFKNEVFESKNVNGTEKVERYRLLSRMKMDCEYYLGNGGRYAGHLWAGNETEQIKDMISLYRSFGKRGAPKWLSLEQLRNYSTELTGKTISKIMAETVTPDRQVSADEKSLQKSLSLKEFIRTKFGTDELYEQTSEAVRKAANKFVGEDGLYYGQERPYHFADERSALQEFAEHPENFKFQLGNAITEISLDQKNTHYAKGLHSRIAFAAVNLGDTAIEFFDETDSEKALPKLYSLFANEIIQEADRHVSVEKEQTQKPLQEQIYDRYIKADIPPVFGTQEQYARKIAQEISSAIETKREIDIGTIRSHLSMKNDRISFEEKKLVKQIFEENTGLKLPEFVNDYDAFDGHMNQVISEWAKSSGQTASENQKAETLPEKPARQKKEKRNVAKSKGEMMSAEEFSRLYGRDFDEREFPIWRATDWQGNIDLNRLSESDRAYMKESGNYVCKRMSGSRAEWTHKVLFTTGDIYAKIEEQKKLLAEAENGLPDDDARKARRELYESNIALLESVKKPELDLEHIHFGVKTTLAEEFKLPHVDADGKRVELNLQESFILWATNETLATQKVRGDIDFATANISQEELGEDVSFYDIVNYIDGKPVKAEAVRGWRTYDMTEEEKAAERAERKKEADLKRQARADTANRLFDRFVHEGIAGDQKRLLVSEYNRRFNSYVAPDWSRLPLFVEGMSAYKGESKFRLYDQQIKGISFLCNKGNGLLAYDVGVGKTAAGIVATVNQIQTGRSRRPLIVVPNQVYSKWYTDIRQLFPAVQVNDLYNFSKESVAKFIDKDNPHKLSVPEGSISLCTYEALKNITFTDESCERALYQDFSSLLSADFDGSERERAMQADKIKNAIGSASQVKNENYFFFEDCGFDNLTVDEAHNFKNLWVVPRPKNKGESNEYAGIPSGKSSARALKMYAMTQLVQRNNDDRNVFMLTATPFTNSPTEVYSMLSYIARERLQRAGLTSLRSFFDQFAQTKQELGVTSTGNIDTKQVMKSWKELPALQGILTEFIDKVDGEEAGIIRPNKFTHVKPLDMSALQKEMRDIDEERMAEVKAGNSAAVIVAMNNMRLACVAPALANPAMYPGVKLPPLTELVETSPKLKFVCDVIVGMYKGNHEKGQFMYVPLGKESHGIIKDYLVRHGIPKEAVEIINGEINSTPEKKERITSRFNDEKHPLKIIIGGKNTCEGIDLNGNSFVMYNCSLGWNPSETIQAEGRIWRQGNLQGNVHIVYPVMNDSIDSVLYQKHDEKRSRINELWNYKGDSLNVEDINPEDLKIELIKDPAKRAKLILQEETKEARAELSRLTLKIKSFDDIISRRKQLSLDFSGAKDMTEHYEAQIKGYKERELKVPDWITVSLREQKQALRKAEREKSKVEDKLSALGIKTDDDMMKYVRSLNVQKHACKEKIRHAEETLPGTIARLRAELHKQKAAEYPVEKQREVLESDILNNLRPMSEVAYEVKTVRFESMLAAKLDAGDITREEHDEYKKAGFEQYEKWQNGEIASLEKNAPKTEMPAQAEAAHQETEIDRHVPGTKTKTQIIPAADRQRGKTEPAQQSGQLSLFDAEELDTLAISQQTAHGVTVPKVVAMPTERQKRRKVACGVER